MHSERGTSQELNDYTTQLACSNSLGEVPHFVRDDRVFFTNGRCALVGALSTCTGENGGTDGVRDNSDHGDFRAEDQRVRHVDNGIDGEENRKQ